MWAGHNFLTLSELSSLSSLAVQAHLLGSELDFANEIPTLSEHIFQVL